MLSRTTSSCRAGAEAVGEVVGSSPVLSLRVTDASLESLLACPACRGRLQWSDSGGVCSSCGAGYSLEGGVPTFIAGEPMHGTSGRLRRLLENERLYDLLQRVLGYPTAARRLQSVLGDTRDHVLLDVGGGTGNLIPYLSEGTHYVCLDNDPTKLDRLLRKRPGTMAVLGDATHLPFADKSVDETVCVAVTHHLSDDVLPLLIDELGRVTRGRVIVFDPLREERTRRGKLLWRIDRGSFPRTESELASFLARGLIPQHLERFAIHHHYLLWVGVPQEQA